MLWGGGKIWWERAGGSNGMRSAGDGVQGLWNESGLKVGKALWLNMVGRPVRTWALPSINGKEKDQG